MPNTVQTLDARYIDGAKLLELLKTLFGPGNFQINVYPHCSFLSCLQRKFWLTALLIKCIDDSYTLIIPERLTRVCITIEVNE